MKRDVVYELMKRYKFQEALSDEARDILMRKKKELFILVLKRSGNYSVLCGIALALLYFLKKGGITVSLIKAYTIVLLGSMLVAASIVYSGYTLMTPTIMKKIPESAEPVPLALPHTIHRTHNNIVVRKPQKTVSPIPDNAIAVKPFVTGTINAVYGKRVSRKIIAELKKQLGSSRIYLFSKKDASHFAQLLSGSIQNDKNKKYIISIRIIQVDTGTINKIIVQRMNSLSPSEINKACTLIAGRLAYELK
jgi:hypothetical protein